MVIVAVEQHFPRLETGGKQGPCRAPPVRARIFGNGQLARTSEDPQRLTGRPTSEAGEGRMGLLGGKQVGGVEQGQCGQLAQLLQTALAIGAGVTGAILADMGEQVIELLQLLLLSQGGGANFQSVVIVLHEASLVG